jgi:DNA-binding response OmpR family regulator
MQDDNGPTADPPNGDPAPSGSVPDDVLLVEDNTLIALDTEDILRQMGVRSVRAARTVAEALAAIDERAPGFALLDVNLGRETSFAIAWRLRDLGVRFAFVTGYGDDAAFAGAFGDVPKIRKPYTAEALRAGFLHPPEPFKPPVR